MVQVKVLLVNSIFLLSGLHIHERHSCNIVDYLNSIYRNENINYNNSMTAMLLIHEVGKKPDNFVCFFDHMVEVSKASRSQYFVDIRVGCFTNILPAATGVLPFDFASVLQECGQCQARKVVIFYKFLSLRGSRHQSLEKTSS